MSNPASAHWFVQPDFFPRAADMRAEYEARVRPAREFSPTRLVWDYWYVEGQYAYLRSPAQHFFSPQLYRNFIASLRQWGEQNVGCGQCTDLWISYYIEGCCQNLHTDVGQGTWGVVFSLTPPGPPAFSGGETALLRPSTLDYWRHFDSSHAAEREELVEHIPPHFNQLLVFDARFPHAVTPVHGTRDPLLGRVVLHGWFRPPALRVWGDLTLGEVKPIADEIGERWSAMRRHNHVLHGSLLLRLTIAADGRPEGVTVIVSSLMSLDGRTETVRDVQAAAIELAAATIFPTRANPSSVLLPLNASDR